MERLADLMGHTTIDTVQRHYRHPETNVIDVAPEVWGQGASQGASDGGKETVVISQVKTKKAKGRG